MIELQSALLVAGLVVFVIVAIISYDKYRSGNLSGRLKDLGQRWLGGDDDTSESSVIVRMGGDSELRARTRHEPQLVSANRVEPQLEPASQAVPEPRLPSEPQFEPEPEPADPGPALESVPHSPAAEPHPYVEPSTKAVEPPLWRTELDDAERIANQSVLSDEVFEHMDGSGDTDDELPIELVARIPGSNIIKRDTALGLYRQYEFDLKKHHRIYGLSHPAKMWCDLERQPESAGFTDFGLTLQLADRQGAVSESELNRFSQLVLRFADVFGRRFKFSIPFEDALQVGRRLDDLCKKYDSVAILNVVARNENILGLDLDRQARDMGFQMNKRCVYLKRDPSTTGGHGLYSLANLRGDGTFPKTSLSQLTTDGVSLFINIPCTKNPAQIFGEMVADAKELCKRLDAKLVDQNSRGMTQKGLKGIGQEIRQMATNMERDGLSPGSAKARRLF